MDIKPTNEEWIKLTYGCAKQFLYDITPSVIRGSELSEYFDIEKIFKSTNDILFRLLESLQNRQQSTNVIGFNREDRKTAFATVLCGYDCNSILSKYTEESLYNEFCRCFPVSRRDEKNNLWHKYVRSVLSASQFISNFNSVEDFDQFIDLFSYNQFSSAALPMLLEKEVFGLGFALACDFLKELGYSQYPKPDVHIIDIFSALGLCEKSDYSAYKAVINMARLCNDTSYNVDKTFWLIASGRYYLHNYRQSGHKQEFIDFMLEKQI